MICGTVLQCHTCTRVPAGTGTRVQPHPDNKRPKIPGFFVRYSEVLEEIPYRGLFVWEQGCEFPEGSFVIARFAL